jgi:hypothetical protein
MTEVATVLPNELRLGAPATMPQARSYMFRQQSTLQNYGSGNQIQINIPRLQRSYLRKDSYLKFNVDITETGDMSLNNPLQINSTAPTLTFDSAGAYGLIQKIEIFDYLGSTVLESISEVPQLMALLLDLGIPGIDHSTNGQAAMGLETGYTSSDSINSYPTSTTANAARQTVFNQNTKLRAASSGRTLVSWGNNGQATTSSTRENYYSAEFAIPLPSFLGFLSKKMVPLHNGFTILITLSNPTTALFTPGQSIGAPAIVCGAGVTVTSAAWNAAGSTDDNPNDGGPTFKFTAPFGTTANAPPVKGSQISTAGFEPDQYNATFQVVDSTYNTVTVATSVATNPGAVTTYGTINIGNNTYFYNHPNLTIPAASNGNYTMNVTDVYMDCQILELGPVAESMILSSTGGQPLVVHTKSFRSYVGNVNKAAQEFILNLNLNVASMTNLLWMMRSKDQLDKINHQSIGNRTRNMLQRWVFQYGSTSLPQNNGIQTMGTTYPSKASSLFLKYLTAESKCSEGYHELLKARPIDVQNCRILQENFSWDYKWGGILSDSTADTSLRDLMNTFSFSFPNSKPTLFPGKFAAGLTLELANNKSGDLISGLNTNGMNTSIRGVFHPLFSDYQDDVRVDAYAEYDAFINISPGIATTVSF